MPTRLQWLRARVIHASFAETQIETHDVHRLVVGFVDGDGERLTNSRPYGERFLLSDLSIWPRPPPSGWSSDEDDNEEVDDEPEYDPFQEYGLELRVAADGISYSRDEFIAYYGGTEEWDAAAAIPPP